MYQGLLNKAKRGEVFNHPPMGYIKLPTGEFALDPDEQVQSVMRLLFAEFERQGSLHGLLRYLVQQGIRLPVRPHCGPNRSRLEWRRPNRATLQNVLRRPIYAGYYRWGHRIVDPRRKVAGRPGTGRTVHKPEECLVLLQDRCPAYLTVGAILGQSATSRCQPRQRPQHPTTWTIVIGWFVGLRSLWPPAYGPLHQCRLGSAL